MKSWLARTALAAVLVVFAFSAGVLYGSRKESRVEDIVRAEMLLLQKNSGTPTCAEIDSKAYGQIQKKDTVIHWRIEPATGRLSRVVVAPDLTVAYEELDSPCGISRR